MEKGAENGLVAATPDSEVVDAEHFGATGGPDRSLDTKPFGGDVFTGGEFLASLASLAPPSLEEPLGSQSPVIPVLGSVGCGSAMVACVPAMVGQSAEAAPRAGLVAVSVATMRDVARLVASETLLVAAVAVCCTLSVGAGVGHVRPVAARLHRAGLISACTA